MVTVPVCSKLKTENRVIVFTNKAGKNSRYFVGVFNKTIIPLTLVEYEMIVAITHTLYPHCIPEPHNHIIIVKRYERVAE